ncbi:MAG: ATP-binding cassette domain-containing protein [Candidatus Caenarcaniphilales bacterium]|nr:ATP-binding cassette domain-containing protein [Candidatus Caenarcaniphilales bacterium]
MALLELKNLNKSFDLGSKFLFKKSDNLLHVVRDISLNIEEGECFVLVGESGCGKSTLAKLVCRILEPDSGEVHFNNENFLDLKANEFRKKRKAMQMVFQNPFSSLDPRFKIFDSIAEPLRVNKGEEGFPKTEAEIKDKVFELMGLVELDEILAQKYPHQCSGGQNQRVCIARAIACNPKLIIADEAVSALDVSVQWIVLRLMKKLKDELGISFLFITHDLAVVKYIADRVGVMYLGEIVELSSKENLFKNPSHPYTKALLNAAPIPDPKLRERDRIFLEGEIPKANKIPSGCTFHTRCPQVFEDCKTTKPNSINISDNNEKHCVSCLLYK